MIRALCLLALLMAVGCDNMANQPRDKTWQPADALPDRKIWPPKPPPHTIAREDVVPAVPALTPALIERGHQRFDIYCSPCHGFTGKGDGMIVRRGFPAPPSFHTDRLRSAPTRHFVEVVENGWGAMYSYADRVAEPDRWAIAAYIRALQETTSGDIASLPDSVRETLK